MSLKLVILLYLYASGSSSFTLVKFYLVGYGDEDVSVQTAFYNLVRSFREGNFRISMPDGDSCSVDSNSLQSKCHLYKFHFLKKRKGVSFISICIMRKYKNIQNDLIDA